MWWASTHQRSGLSENMHVSKTEAHWGSTWSHLKPSEPPLDSFQRHSAPRHHGRKECDLTPKAETHRYFMMSQQWKRENSKFVFLHGGLYLLWPKWHQCLVGSSQSLELFLAPGMDKQATYRGRRHECLHRASPAPCENYHKIHPKPKETLWLGVCITYFIWGKPKGTEQDSFWVSSEQDNI